jgi:hypothetical protein
VIVICRGYNRSQYIRVPVRIHGYISYAPPPSVCDIIIIIVNKGRDILICIEWSTSWTAGVPFPPGTRYLYLMHGVKSDCGVHPVSARRVSEGCLPSSSGSARDESLTSNLLVHWRWERLSPLDTSAPMSPITAAPHDGYFTQGHKLKFPH